MHTLSKVLCRAASMLLLLALAQARDVPVKEAASKYYAHADLSEGAAMGADFLGRYLPVGGMTVYSDEFIFVEVAILGKSGKRVEIKNDQFSLRINGTALAPQAPGVITTFNNFPEMESRPDVVLGDGSGQIDIGGSGRKPRFPGDDPAHTPTPLPQAPADPAGGQVQRKPPNPDELVRGAELPTGSRSLPVAGYLFFHYEGKLKKIKHAELEYKGALGNATLTLR
jgi:hypothetical protein